MAESDAVCSCGHFWWGHRTGVNSDECVAPGCACDRFRPPSDGRAELEKLARWCDAQRAVPKEKFLRYANQEYNEGYRDAMEAVARRIREVPK